MKRLVATIAALLTGCAEAPQPVELPPPGTRVIPTIDGAVYIADEDFQQDYDADGYAPVRRVGDLVYISGVIVRRRDGEGNDVTAFKNQVRRAFRRLNLELKAAGLGFENVAMVNTFHVWSSPNFAGARDEQFKAFAEAKNEFMRPPYAAWTAVGTTGLLSDSAIVEIQLVAHVPPKRPRTLPGKTGG